MITSELSGGARFAELAGWSQEERDLAAETIYRFVFRSLYEVRSFNGDPHPGNYLFHGAGRVTFLDFGLVKHFTPAELQPLMQMNRRLCLEHDPEAFRRSLESAGFLRPHAPLRRRRSSSTWLSFTTPSVNESQSPSPATTPPRSCAASSTCAVQ